MSLNLGPVAFEAVINLQHNPAFKDFKDALHDQMSSLMHRAIEGPVADRADATGYARAIRDLVAHIEQIENPKPGNRLAKPPVKSAHV